MVKNKDISETNAVASYKKKGIKRQNIMQLVFSLIIIISINIIGSYIFKRIDLTSEKRYTLSNATKKLLKNLDDIVYFKVYLDGDFPAGFRQLRNETKEMLNQFRAYSDNIQYEFINPSASSDKKQTRDLYKQLVSKGLQPTNLQTNKNEGSSQQIIFPGAIVTYKERELPLQLLNTRYDIKPEVVLNSSVEGLEYNIASAIKKLSVMNKPKLAFIEGHGELDKYETGDISTSLSEYFNVQRVRINDQVNALKDFKVIIIAKPDSIFDEKDKFIIDQFIMKGGKVLWLVDPVFASMDSLRTSDQTIGIAQRLGLEDQLFKYGARINYDLIQDIMALQIPVKTGNIGTQPQMKFFPWYFFPLAMPAINHPIVNNLNAVKFEFVSSIDTVGAKSISKTILLTTSKYSRTLATPVTISLDIMQKEPDERLYDKSYIPIAVLLEGTFPSLYKDRISDTIAKDKSIDFRESSVPNRMIVISDGDVIRNQVQESNGIKYPLPLGYNKYTRESFGNRDFILNCVDYLCDESGLIQVRSRELKLRLLDKTIIDKDKLMIQLINTGLPILLVICFGIIQGIIRKRKYAR